MGKKNKIDPIEEGSVFDEIFLPTLALLLLGAGIVFFFNIVFFGGDAWGSTHKTRAMYELPKELIIKKESAQKKCLSVCRQIYGTVTPKNKMTCEERCKIKR